LETERSLAHIIQTRQSKLEADKEAAADAATAAADAAVAVAAFDGQDVGIEGEWSLSGYDDDHMEVAPRTPSAEQRPCIQDMYVYHPAPAVCHQQDAAGIDFEGDDEGIFDMEL
jgi:hypothetical protein